MIRVNELGRDSLVKNTNKGGELNFYMKEKNSFAQNCYLILKRVPKGRVTTYKSVAHALKTKAYRAVGNAMNKNPYAPIVPCHRVVCSDGSLGGFAFGTSRKIAILKKEGVSVKNNKIANFQKIFFKL